MPITTHPHQAETYRGDLEHWIHVMDHLFVPAIEAAGFAPVKPISKGSAMIHADIVKRLETCDMVLCDLSGENPNVFFELGVRTSLDKPIAIVRDDKTRIPFDLGGTNVHEYSSALDPWTLDADVSGVAQHLRDAEITCSGTNPLWQQYGLTIRAQEPSVDASPLEAKIDLLMNRMTAFEQDLETKAATTRTASRPAIALVAERWGVSRERARQLVKQLEGWCSRESQAASLWINNESTLFKLDGHGRDSITDAAAEELRTLLSKMQVRIAPPRWVPSQAEGWVEVAVFPPF